MSPLPTSYTPGKPQMFEAHKLCQSAQAGTTRAHLRMRTHVHMPTRMRANALHSRPCLGQAMHSCSIAWAWLPRLTSGGTLSIPSLLPSAPHTALEFQDHITAVHALRQALQLLTLPPAPVS